MSWLVRTPDHLGDGVMAIPAIQALEKHFSLLIEGPPWTRALYPNHRYLSAKQKHPSQEGVFLFKPSFGAAWRHRHHPIRIGMDVNHRGFLLTHRVQPKTKHRIDGYLDIVRTVIPSHNHLPTFYPNRCPIPEISRDSILCVVGTASAETVRWKQFHALQAHRDRLIFVGGPNNESFLRKLEHEGFHTLSPLLNLHQVGQIAQKASFLIGIDGGLTHLAIAARNAVLYPKETNLVLYGSTDPQHTGPRHSHPIQKRDLPSCWPCYSKNCSIQTPCLDIPVSTIAEFLSSCQPS